MNPIPVAFCSDGPARYLQLAMAIRRAIKTGELSPGMKLSSARTMAQAYALNRHTVMNALQILVAEGWLESQERSGYRVTHSLPIDSSLRPDLTLSKHRTVAVTERYQTRNFNWPIVYAAQASLSLSDYRYNFAGGLPDLAEFPFDEFKRALGSACQRLDTRLLHYGEVSGVPDLKAQITAYLAKARGLVANELLICNGSQEALFLIAKAFIAQGACIAVETLGYPPARKAFIACGATLVDIRQDEYGLCVEDLAKQLRAHPIKLLYLTPLHQYPTTVTLSMTRRMQIYQLCYEHGVAIIEDDYDHEFHYRCQPIAPMASDDPAGIVIYVATFSKLMFAGARLGYIVCSDSIMSQLTALKQLVNHKNDVLTQLGVAQWMKEGGFERHAKRMTKLYKNNYQHLDRLLQAYQAQGYPVRYDKPDGGMAMWVDMGVNVNQLKEKAKLSGVYVQTQSEFYFEHSMRSLRGDASQYTHIRLGFAGQSPDMLAKGLQIIIDILYE
ncbi:PLP-dependent aminotransferase family protein [Pseudoalteromonas aurantia]|uniref:PLP-dependent aminotransferase family protein n=2 Tax=Pseudoalteromonas TaxID=53246 RepID=A0A5S3V8B5_9GAMM|nr:PLP-dependent aminotransferase family protein [Pseudoalteromonas aurantia]TMO62255.1 PLP-dependent aminotransferase family protein [Pseudoalteromonas aurantia]TMO67548.1 PLP-dependent aminotransferase family protein [Pseudoalteromonas aurantia]